MKQPKIERRWSKKNLSWGATFVAVHSKVRAACRASGKMSSYKCGPRFRLYSISKRFSTLGCSAHTGSYQWGGTVWDDLRDATAVRAFLNSLWT